MIQTNYSQKELSELIEKFQDRSLPSKRWTHEAHLIVALWYLRKYPLAEATHYLRTGIISYHSSQGGQHTLSRGYHETLTRFWIWAVDQFLEKEKNRDLTFVEQVEKFLQSPWADKKLPWQYYSEEYIKSIEARAYFVHPLKYAIS